MTKPHKYPLLYKAIQSHKTKTNNKPPQNLKETKQNKWLKQEELQINFPSEQSCKKSVNKHNPRTLMKDYPSCTYMFHPRDESVVQPM